MPIFKLQAIDPGAPEWKGMFTGPIWVCAKDGPSAHGKVAGHTLTSTARGSSRNGAAIEPSPWYQRKKMAKCDQDYDREEVPENGIAMADERPMPASGMPTRWLSITTKAEDAGGWTEGTLREEYHAQHVRREEMTVYRRKDGGDMISYYISPEALADPSFDSGWRVSLCLMPGYRICRNYADGDFLGPHQRDRGSTAARPRMTSEEDKRPIWRLATIGPAWDIKGSVWLRAPLEADARGRLAAFAPSEISHPIPLSKSMQLPSVWSDKVRSSCEVGRECPADVGAILQKFARRNLD